MSFGPTLLFFGLIPIFAVMIITGDFTALTGSNLWIELGVAIALGLVAAITAVGSGLNTYGTFLTFVLTFTTTLYVSFVISTASITSAIPYGIGLIIDGVSVFCYVLGIFFILTGLQN